MYYHVNDTTLMFC